MAIGRYSQYIPTNLLYYQYDYRQFILLRNTYMNIVLGRAQLINKYNFTIVLTLSLSFSRTNNLRILKGALNQRGAVTMSTFFSLAG